MRTAFGYPAVLHINNPVGSDRCGQSVRDKYRRTLAREAVYQLVDIALRDRVKRRICLIKDKYISAVVECPRYTYPLSLPARKSQPVAGKITIQQLAFVVAVSEMFTIAKQIASAQTTMMPFVIAAVFYFVFNLLVAIVMDKIEKKLNYYR